MKKMNKIIAFMLAIVLLLGISCAAYADGEPEAESQCLAIMAEDLTTEEMASAENRGYAMALLILDYCLLFDGNAEEIDVSRPSYICAWSDVTIDAYIALTDGTYENMFFGMATHNITDFGRSEYTGFMSDEEHTYNETAGSEIATVLAELSQLISEGTGTEN